MSDIVNLSGRPLKDEDIQKFVSNVRKSKGYGSREPISPAMAEQIEKFNSHSKSRKEFQKLNKFLRDGAAGSSSGS